MPPGEEMFKYHGYSGACPKPPLPIFKTKTGLELIADECRRQVAALGWIPEHQHHNQQKEDTLARAAAAYAVPAKFRTVMVAGDLELSEFLWPWERSLWNPTPDDRLVELVKAGALIVAEIERLQRTCSAQG